MGAKSSIKTTDKQSKSTSSDAAGSSSNRLKRIKKGRQVLKEAEERHAETVTNFVGHPTVSPGTLRKYRAEAIRAWAAEREVEVDVVEIDVELAELAERARLYTGDRLAESVESGELDLNRKLLRQLLKVDGGDLKKKLKSLLAEQL